MTGGFGPVDSGGWGVGGGEWVTERSRTVGDRLTGGPKRGRWPSDRHSYELFLPLAGIKHPTIKVRRPRSRGFIEPFHRTLPDEHLRVKRRTTWYETVEEMQTDLDAYLETYNRNRPHCGRGMEGRTPYKVFKAGLPKARKAAKAKPPKEDANAA